MPLTPYTCCCWTRGPRRRCCGPTEACMTPIPAGSSPISGEDVMAEQDWVAVLREECDRTSQPKTAARLGVSPAMVNQVLKGVYKGNWERIETLVRGELMNKTVECPILGEISCRRCLDEQARP